MAKIRLNNGKSIGDGQKPYIIAELNSSHNGKAEHAKRMIDAAKECGCDCVKFQSWTADTLYSEQYYSENPISRRMIKGFSLNENQLYELWRYCQEIGIDFSSTPYSEQEVDFLAEKVKAPFIKIASMEINNLPFLKYIAGKQIPMILSTGMSSYEEIGQAVEVIKGEGNQNLCILHCVSVYPANADMINLNNIIYLKERFPEFPVGYSDHTIGSEIACGAVALGAAVIEKHFTLDHSKIGMDNHMATEPKEMGELIQNCLNVYNALGSRERMMSKSEMIQASKMRRSIVAKTDLSEGTVLEEQMLDYKRPGAGISPSRNKEVIGRILGKSIKKGFMILPDDLV